MKFVGLRRIAVATFTISLFHLAPLQGLADPLASPYVNPLEDALRGKKCEIWDDEQGIPHIHATEVRIGIACLGYIHARDRAWQMDFFKKTVQGRKAEFFGKDFIRSDFILRILGLQEKANSLFQQMSSEDQEFFWAYSWGVNRGMKEAMSRGVYEFQKFNYSPDTWRPQDTLAISLLQSFDQTRRTFVTQLEDYERTHEFGEKALSLFNPVGLPWDTSILKSTDFLHPMEPSILENSVMDHSPLENQPAENNPSKSKKTTSDSDRTSLTPILGGPDLGSNSWVLSPKLMKSGKALLANDPHLKLSRPSFWHWVHLEAGKIDAIGASFPGVPSIFSGTNRHVSWGLTNSFLPASKLTFVANSELAQAKTFRPLIWVKFWKFKLPFFFKSFQRTSSQLPVLPLPNLPPGKSAILRWTGFDLNAKDFTGLFNFMRSQTVREMDHALAQIGVPSWNFNFADDQGAIGYRAIGRIYRPTPGGGFSIPTQTLAEVENNPEFSHPLTSNEMPHIINPERGYVATANNTHWPADAPLTSGRAPYTGFRAFRIEELLKASPRHDVESNRKIQCDVQAVDARFLLPKLLTTLAIAAPFDLNREETSALNLLKAWNFETQLDCLACGIFRTWMQSFYDSQKLNAASLFRSLDENPSLEWQQKLLSTFRETVARLSKKGTQDFPKWGELHVNYFRHLADPNFLVLPPLGTPGDEATVNPGSENDHDHPLEHTDGASQRMIVEMTSPPQVYSILPGTNVDRIPQSMTDPLGPWQEWEHCQMKKRNFPVDWNKIPTKTLLHL